MGLLSMSDLRRCMPTLTATHLRLLMGVASGDVDGAVRIRNCALDLLDCPVPLPQPNEYSRWVRAEWMSTRQSLAAFTDSEHTLFSRRLLADMRTSEWASTMKYGPQGRGAASAFNASGLR